jgi:DNA-binding MarR family transcriptional regulator
MTSQVLRSLEKRELLIRQQKQGDERAKYPELTPIGLDKLKAAMKDVEAVDQEFFSPLQGNLPEFRQSLQILLPG